MLIRLGYDIQFDVQSHVPMVALLNVHPSRLKDLREPDRLQVEPHMTGDEYIDSFGNHCRRFLALPGTLRLSNSTLIEDSGLGDAQNPDAREIPVEQLPPETLQFLLSSRYCEVDLLSNTAVELFGGIAPGFQRVQLRPFHQDRTARLHGTDGSVPGLSASCNHLLPMPEYTGTLRNRLSRGHRRSCFSFSDGFQCMVRGISGRQMVDVRREA
jgi:hypothetical protein